MKRIEHEQKDKERRIEKDRRSICALHWSYLCNVQDALNDTDENIFLLAV